MRLPGACARAGKETFYMNSAQQLPRLSSMPCPSNASETARGLQEILLLPSVGIAPLHFIEERLVNQALALGEGRNQPTALL
jgi:hypothetical protein